MDIEEKEKYVIDKIKQKYDIKDPEIAKILLVKCEGVFKTNIGYEFLNDLETILKNPNNKNKSKNFNSKTKKQLEVNKNKINKIKKNTIIGLICIFLSIFFINITFIIYNNMNYSMTSKEKINYNIANSNYKKIKDFKLSADLNYYSIASKYHDNNYDFDHIRKNRIIDAEMDNDYVYSRSMFLSSSLLFELIKDQYPQKYHVVYNQLIDLHKEEIYNSYLTTESGQVKNNYLTKPLERKIEVSENIKELEKYLNNKTLNTNKSFIININNYIPYDKIYNINLGILYDENMEIKYIGEFKDNEANGYGIAWYSIDNKNYYSSGEFENGKIKNTKQYNKISKPINLDSHSLDNFCFKGDFKSITYKEGVLNINDGINQVKEEQQKKEENISKAKSEVNNLVNKILSKSPNINKINWNKNPTINGNYYYFSCDVEFDNYIKREGTIIVKEEFGVFKADRLQLKD